MFRNCVLFIIIGILGQVEAKQWHTAKNGWWDDSTTWVGGIPAPNVVSDTVYIHHLVVFRHNLEHRSAFFQIDSVGGLCGFKNLTCGVKSTMIKYGALCCDSLFVLGGDCKAIGPGNLLVRKFMRIAGPGSASFAKLPGCYMHVGANYECNIEAGFKEKLGTFFTQVCIVKPFPVPFSRYIRFSVPFDAVKYKLDFYTMTGKLLGTFDGTVHDGIISAEPECQAGAVFYTLTFIGIGKTAGVIMKE